MLGAFPILFAPSALWNRTSSRIERTALIDTHNTWRAVALIFTMSYQTVTQRNNALHSAIDACLLRHWAVTTYVGA